MPAPWQLSPRGVLAYVTGSKKPLRVTASGKTTEVKITRKFFGDDTIVERAIVTLASERALLLVGDPGTGKSWLSEHLAAAICGDSTLTIQGTAGTTEEHIKYSWNIARVIAEGPKPENLIPSPTMVAMRGGGLLRFEEITRCVPDVQDALVSILSDKAIAVPELPDANMVWAKPGFNIIATANTRDQGVNELSAALKRRSGDCVRRCISSVKPRSRRNCNAGARPRSTRRSNFCSTRKPCARRPVFLPKQPVGAHFFKSRRAREYVVKRRLRDTFKCCDS